MKTLEQLRAELREKLAALKELKAKAYSPDKTEADEEAFEKALDAIEAVEKEINRMERAERVEALSSKLADAPVAPIGHNSGAVPAQVKEAKPEEVLAIIAASVIKGRHEGESPFKIMTDAGYGQIANDLAPHNKKGLNTLVSAEGGILVPQAQIGGVLPLLRQQTTFLEAGPTPVEFVNGQYTVGRQASGASAAYVGEGGLKPVSTITFDAIDMRSKKLAGIVTMTEEVTRWSLINLRNFVQNDLRTAMATIMDRNMWMGTGAGMSPTGVFNKAGIQTIATAPFFAVDATPTAQELDRLADAMVLALISNGLTPGAGRWRWVMSYRTAMYLGSMRLGDSNEGDLAYPSMANAGLGQATFRGFPVTVTAEVPTNLGTGTNESFIALVDMNHVLFGEEMAINVRWSNQAVIDPDGSGDNNILLFQQNMEAVLAESMHDVGLRYAKAVVKATGILF